MTSISTGTPGLPERDDASAGNARLGRLAARLSSPDEQPLLPRPLWDVLRTAAGSHRAGILTGLICTYTTATVAIFAATIGAIIGTIIELVFIFTHAAASSLSPTLFGQAGFNVFDILGGALVGAFIGFLTVARALLGAGLWPLFASLATGAIVALGLTLLIISGERHWLRLRGYRRMSWDEEERVRPLARAAATGLGIDPDGLPPILVADQKQAGAWAHCTAIVVTSHLLVVLDDNELRGILAHELYHWKDGHAVGQRLIWASALPLVLVYNGAAALSRTTRSALVAAVLAILLWPAWVAIRLLIIPAQARSSRTDEYAADAATAGAGAVFRDGLRSALLKLSAFEPGRTGWEAATAATHPPTALRVERLIPLEEAQRRAAELARRAAERAQRRQRPASPAP